MKSLKQSVERYHETLQNTTKYREAWNSHLKIFVKKTLEQIIRETGLKASVEVKSELENLEGILLSMGQEDSQIYERLENGMKRSFVKDMGALLFQQLFNGKIIVMVHYPLIDSYGEPNPPKTLGIFRPEELTEAALIRNMEEFIDELTEWEDLDDAETSNRIGFTWNMNPPEQA